MGTAWYLAWLDPRLLKHSSSPSPCSYLVVILHDYEVVWSKTLTCTSKLDLSCSSTWNRLLFMGCAMNIFLLNRHIYWPMVPVLSTGEDLFLRLCVSHQHHPGTGVQHLCQADRERWAWARHWAPSVLMARFHVLLCVPGRCSVWI